MEFCVANRAASPSASDEPLCFAVQSIYVLRDNLFRLNDGGEMVACFGYAARGANGIHADLLGKERETFRKKIREISPLKPSSADPLFYTRSGRIIASSLYS